MIFSKTEKKEEFFASKRTFENVKKILQTIFSKKEINPNSVWIYFFCTEDRL